MKRSLRIRVMTIALAAGVGCSDDESVVVTEIDAGVEAGLSSSAATTGGQTSATESNSVPPNGDTTSENDDTINATLGTDTTSGGGGDTTSGGGDMTTSGGGDMTTSGGGDTTSGGGDTTSGGGGTSTSDVAGTTDGHLTESTSTPINGSTTSSDEASTSSPGGGTATGGYWDTSTSGYVDTSTGGYFDTTTGEYVDTTGMTMDTGLFTYGDLDAGADAGTSSDVMTSIGVDAGSPCVHAEDCTLPTNPCMAVGCHDGMCMEMPLGQGLDARDQTAGDCKVVHCDGAGQIVIDNDDNDVPNDQQDCTLDSCLNGVAQQTNADASESCDDGTGVMCDGSGNCVECLAPGDCPGQDGECSWRTCNSGICGTANAPGATLLVSQTANDCKKATCAGVVADDTDVPDDNNPCTIDGCNEGEIVSTDEDLGESCGVNLVCNATGDCVGCNTPNDCPGQDDECKARTCSLGGCGWSNTDQGTPVTAQTDDDCREQICDGNGNITWRNDLSDPPTDPSGCSTVSCSNGSAQYSPKNTNDPCGVNDSQYCDGAGACVDCNSGSQCGTSTECLIFTCDSHTCGSSNVDAGTPISAQSPGDCKESQCTGAGGVTIVNNDSDVPDDGNQCTNDVCTAGTPSNTPVGGAVACNQNGGSYCDGAGSCVECYFGADCASGICNNGVCGCAENSDCPSGMCYEAECVTSINGCDIATATDAGAGPVTITFANGNFTYAPKCLKVTQGATVNFSGNFSSHPMEGGVVSGGVEVPANSGPFIPATNSGSGKQVIMSTTGTFPYYCQPHGTIGMNAVIFVEP